MIIFRGFLSYEFLILSYTKVIKLAKSKFSDILFIF